MGCAIKLTGNRHDAEDLFQQTLLTAYRFFDKFEIGTEFGAWAYTIMKNQFLNHQKHLNAECSIPRHQLRMIDGKDRAYYLNDLHLSIPAQSYEEIFCDEVQAAFEKLSPENQSILLLADIKEMPLWEIAEHRNISASTIRSTLRRARNRMRDHLLDFAKSEGYRQGNRKSGLHKPYRSTIKTLEHERSIAGA